MSIPQWLKCGLRATFLAGTTVAAQAAGPELVFRGMANASAAVRVGCDLVLVGTDEWNVLNLYRITGGEPVASFETSPWLGLTTRNGEADFEGAARIGDVVFWLGSHGRNSAGENRPDRQRLLALRLNHQDSTPTLEPLGRPVSTLLDQLVAAPGFTQFNLAAAAQLPPEKPHGLNIEGLAAGPDDSLLIGLRNPVPDGRALVIPLKNPFALMTGKPAEFGEPHLLDLGGRGVRDLVWTGRDFLVIGGSPGDGGKSFLYRWKGGESQPQRVENVSFKGLNPEALVLFGTAEMPRLLVLSDDGRRSGNETRDTSTRTFRAVWVDL